MELQVPTHDLTKFLHNDKDKTLTAEASCLGDAWMSRLWDDACDFGFAIRSHYTQKVERFALTKTEKDRDGDTVAWYFAPVQKLAGVKSVTIFND